MSTDIGVPPTSNVLPTTTTPTELISEDDAKNCYQQWSEERQRSSFIATCMGNSSPFENPRVSLHYQHFLIQSVSKVPVLIWFTFMILYIFGIYVLLTEYDETVWFMRVILICRLLIVALGLWTYAKIFYYCTPVDGDQKEFYHYVKVVTNFSNLIVVLVSLVNGIAYVWKSNRGSCLVFDATTSEYEVDNRDTYFYNCNPSFEVGGTPANSMVILIVGNIFIVSTLRCHSAWAARVNYWVMCLSCISAAAVSPDSGQSTLIVLSAFLCVLIYNDMESSSLGMFKALLELQSTKRIQLNELKQFIGNVAHDLKTPLHGFSMCMEHLHLDSRENLPVGSVKDDIIHTIELCQANCSFMTAAINRTVDFAKSASNFALQPKMESTSILTSMKWTATCMASTQSRIPIVISPIPAEICKYVVTDKHWFMENILCYLSNAVKYSSGGVITVSAHLQDSNVTKSNSSNDKKKPTKQNALSKALSSLLMPSVELVDMSSQASVSDAGACRMLCISVEDEGIGIEGDKGASLFKPFQQTMRMAGGTGLGLFSLAKRVEVLNGSYGVSNRIDGRPGSRFWFTIPYNPDEVYTQQFMDEVSVSESLSNMRNTIGKVGEKEGYSYNEKASQRSAVASCERKVLPVENDVQHKPSRILHALVVEDSLVITKATVRMLKKAGYVVDVAENGAVGLDKMKKIFYSIVIMDLQMPIMDGLEATRRMRSWEDQNAASLVELGRQKQLIVGVSANGADDVMKDALASGMDSFLPKPFSVNNLMNFQISDVDSP